MNKILVINNDFDTMDLLKSWLERKNYEVKFTGNREEVQDLLENFSPQLIIIDSQLKEVAEQLKLTAEKNDVPVLMMTGYTLKQKNKHLAGNDIIEKPFNLSLLEKKIKKLISQ